MPQYVNLGMVDSGCSKIDEGINQFTDVKNCITEAMALLDHNSLRFGGVNSTLEEQLEILKSQLDKCNSMNDGVTSTIRTNAQAQYQEYQNWLEAQRNQQNKRGA
jgi:paraquat-inducible protein B